MAIKYSYIRWISFLAYPHGLRAGYRVSRRNLYAIRFTLYTLTIIIKKYSFRGIAFFDFRGYLLWNKLVSIE